MALPVLKLPDSPSFMVIDGKTFVIERLEHSPESLLNETTRYYERELSSIISTASNFVEREAGNDLVQQIDRLQEFSNRTVVSIPDDLRNNHSIMMFSNNKVHPIVHVLYRPSRLSCTLQRVKEFKRWIDVDITRRDAEKYTKFCTIASLKIAEKEALGIDLSSVKVDITFEQDIVIEPMVCAYLTDQRIIAVEPRGVHSHVYPEGKLCTGNTQADQFWSEPNFMGNFNSLNPHSFANMDCLSSVRHREFLKNSYFINFTIRNQEGAWIA